MFRGNIKIEGSMEEQAMRVSLDYHVENRFLKRMTSVKGFQLTMIALFPDFATMKIEVSHQILPFKYLTNKKSSVFRLAIPEGSKSYLLCCKAEAGDERGELGNSVSKKGMRILTTGDLPDAKE